MRNLRPVAHAALLLLACSGLATAQSVVTPSINHAQTTDTTSGAGLNILVVPPAIDTPGNVAQSAVSVRTFDVTRYGGGNVLTGMSFQGQLASTSISYAGSSLLQTGTVTLGSTVTLGGSSVLGYGLTGRVLGFGGTTMGAYSTAAGSVQAGNLANFYGNGVASSFANAGTWEELLTVDRVGLAAGNFRVDPAAHSATINYTYSTAGHADGSFTGTNSDNVRAFAFTGVGSQGFHVHNGAGLFGLDVDMTSCTGDCSLFNLAGAFTNIAGGGLSAGSIAYLGGGPGTATYTLRVNDTVDSGVIGVGRLSNIESLTITVSAVPEPQAYVLALAGLGFLALTAGARRCRVQLVKA